MNVFIKLRNSLLIILFILFKISKRTNSNLYKYIYCKEFPDLYLSSYILRKCSSSQLPHGFMFSQ
ncbi:hypothetical protein Mgra_00009360 [Meloidogyne graminicola]|uniref:Uncharacterized protein n=1 Tax=Meloidogyne graminicola TaxID=189291 RepID=A0A8S9ZA17_9BILA|nr:hypothetical protein Mgra_00009360 [Meloidogyne graminicola]